MKKLLLTATAMSALAIAGTASAHDLVFRTGMAGGQIDTGDLNNVSRADDTQYNRPGGLTGLYLIATETAFASIGTNTLALSDLLSGNDADPMTPPVTQLPSGNNLYTITLTNGTFAAPVTSANLVGANCTIAPSTGGNTGDRTVTFIVSASGGACEGFSQVNLPVAPETAGLVTVSSEYRTDGNPGSPIDGGADNLDVIFAIDAFQPAFNATLGTTPAGNGRIPGAEEDSFAQIAPVSPNTEPFTTLAGDGNLGRLAIYVDERANRTLAPADGKVAPGDVTAATVIVSGDFSAFDGAAGSTDNPTLTSTGVGGAAASTIISSVNAAADTATFGLGTGGTATAAATAANISRLLSSKPNGSAFIVTADDDVIPFSEYAASISFTLASGFTTQPGAEGDFETIEREGTTFIAPWFSGSLAQSQSFVRMSNTGSATGAITLVLTNVVGSNGVTQPDSTCTISGGVPTAGDLIIDQAQILACNGGSAFVRSDLLITVEGQATNLTAKMRNSSAAGNFETTLGRYSGSVAAGAAQ